MNDKKQETFSTVMLYWIKNNMLWLLFIFALENDFENAKLKTYFTESILLLLFINYTLYICADVIDLLYTHLKASQKHVKLKVAC